MHLRGRLKSFMLFTPRGIEWTFPTGEIVEMKLAWVGLVATWTIPGEGIYRFEEHTGVFCDDAKIATRKSVGKFWCADRHWVIGDAELREEQEGTLRWLTDVSTDLDVVEVKTRPLRRSFDVQLPDGAARLTPVAMAFALTCLVS